MPGKKTFMINLPTILLLLGLTVYFVFNLSGDAYCASSQNGEEKAVLKAARQFLDAEIRQDFPAVYACFAPSSVYARTHTYQQYLAEAKVAPGRVIAYQIIRVSYIQENKDPKTITTADKIAQVEVDVTYQEQGSRKQSVVNIGFIFLKEGGKWYKS